MNVKSLLALFLALSLGIQAQAQCPSSTPGYLSGTWSTMLATDTTAAAVFTTPPTGGLPNTEFLIIQSDSIADDMLGPRVIVSTPDGRFVPADWGLGTCNEACVIPFSYDLSQLQTVVDSLLNANYAPGTTCCDAAAQFFVGLCDSLVAKGITSGADVTDMNDVIVVMSIFAGTAGGSISLDNLISTIDQLNLGIPLFGPCAGGIAELCYAIHDTSTAMDCYTVTLPNSATFVDIDQDTVWVAPNASTTLTGYYLPNSSSDSLSWHLDGSSGGNFVVNAMTGQVTVGSTADTAWISLFGNRGCASDMAVVIVDPALAIHHQAFYEMPLQTIPNPFDATLQVQFYVEAGAYQIELVDVTGRPIYQKQYQFTQGNQYLDLDTQNIPDGYYFLRIRGERSQGVQTVVKGTKF